MAEFATSGCFYIALMVYEKTPSPKTCPKLFQISRQSGQIGNAVKFVDSMVRLGYMIRHNIIYYIILCCTILLYIGHGCHITEKLNR